MMNQRSLRPRATVALASLVALLLFAVPAIAKDSSKISGSMQATGADPDATGGVKVSLKETKSKMSVKVRGLAPLTTHTLSVGGVIEATGTSSGSGSARFNLRTDGTPTLDFDPRGEVVAVSDDSNDVLTMVVSGGGEPSDIRVDERTDLIGTALAPTASGHARFRSKDGRETFSVEIEDVAAGEYTLYVAGIERATISVGATGTAEVEFSSTGESGKILLDFDPRSQIVDVSSVAGVALTGTMSAQAPGVNVCTESEISLALASTGIDPDGHADARFRTRDDCDRDLRVEIEDVPVGSYDLLVGGIFRGTIVVVDTGFGIEGEIEFDTDSDDLNELLLDFDPLGQTIEIVQGATVFFSDTFDGTPGTPTGCVFSETELPLLSSGEIAGAKGEARFRTRDDCDLDFRVEIEDVPVGSYDLFVDGALRGAIDVVSVLGENEGEIEFDSDPDEPDEVLLDFDPRGKLVEVRQGATIVLSRTFDDGSAGGGSGGGSCTFSEIDVDLVNQGVIGSAKGDARFRERVDCQTDLRVQIEDVPVGSYDLFVGGVLRGAIAVTTVLGENQGEIEFDSDPDEPGEVLLDFDPRSVVIEVFQGATSILRVDFPAS
jgi:hypothetical protein